MFSVGASRCAAFGVMMTHTVPLTFVQLKRLRRPPAFRATHLYLHEERHSRTPVGVVARSNGHASSRCRIATFVSLEFWGSFETQEK